MPAPASYTYSVAAKIAARTAFLNLLYTGAGNAKVRLRSSADVLLAEITLADPCATINGTTGLMTFIIQAQEDSAPAGGTVAYGEICDVAGAVHLALPAKIGAAADPGWVVMNTLIVTVNGPVEVSSLSIG